MEKVAWAFFAGGLPLKVGVSVAGGAASKILNATEFVGLPDDLYQLNSSELDFRDRSTLKSMGASPEKTDALFANREGFAVLLDSPASPVMPGLRVSSTRCRFVTPPGHGFLEQVGIGPPDVYRTAIDWLDTGGRYEGSAIFRRIDGAAEREEITFSVAPGRLQHKAVIEGWEEGGPWEHPAPPPSGRRAVPGS
jgi:hypothetical protein